MYVGAFGIIYVLSQSRRLPPPSGGELLLDLKFVILNYISTKLNVKKR